VLFQADAPSIGVTSRLASVAALAFPSHKGSFVQRPRHQTVPLATGGAASRAVLGRA